MTNKMNQPLLSEVVKKEIDFLNLDNAESKQLASLYRHNVNKQLGEKPELYGRILQILPEEFRGDICAEYAVFIALTLASFAKNNGPNNIATAISKINQNENIIRRFRLAEISKNIDEMRIHLRRVVKIMSSEKTTLNYANLADDLYKWQKDKPKQIRMWERSLIQ